MFKTPKSALVGAASLFVLPALALTPAFAQETGSIGPASSVTVQRIDALDTNAMQEFDSLSAAKYEAAQALLSSNPSLVSSLRAQGVQINNVVKVIEFSNGEALVYVR